MRRNGIGGAGRHIVLCRRTAACSEDRAGLPADGAVQTTQAAGESVNDAWVARLRREDPAARLPTQKDFKWSEDKWRQEAAARNTGAHERSQKLRAMMTDALRVTVGTRRAEDRSRQAAYYGSLRHRPHRPVARRIPQWLPRYSNRLRRDGQNHPTKPIRNQMSQLPPTGRNNSSHWRRASPFVVCNTLKRFAKSQPPPHIEPDMATQTNRQRPAPMEGRARPAERCATFRSSRILAHFMPTANQRHPASEHVCLRSVSLFPGAPSG